MYALLRHRVGRHALLFPPQTQNPTQRLPRRPWVLSNPLPLTLTLTLTLALTLALTPKRITSGQRYSEGTLGAH